MIDLKGKVALVTGASRGIGAAAVRHLAECGAAIILQARSGDAIMSLADEIKRDGGQALACVGDVASYDDVLSAVSQATDRFGGLHILVNNAGVIDPIARLAESDPGQWDQVVDINFKGVYHGIRAALPLMLAQGGGTIINISSGAAIGALEGWSHYCATKAGVLSLTKCTDKEYREQGIRCLGLSPGTVATEMQIQIKASGVNPVSQLDSSVHIPPEWVAKAISWLCTAEADGYRGMDFSIKTPEGRQAVGLPVN